MDTYRQTLLLELLNELVACASVHRNGPEWELLFEITASLDALFLGKWHDMDFLREHLDETTDALLLGNPERQVEIASRFATAN